MKHFLSISDIGQPNTWVREAIDLKKKSRAHHALGIGKTLGLLFFNNSLRTRVSTQLAAQNLGLETIVMNFGQEGWSLEYTDGSIMDAGTAEHIKEAAAVMGQYCDIIGIRAFAGLEDRELDRKEIVLNGFKKYAGVPILNMESSLEHPLQALADAITIEENRSEDRPKVVISWAPHPRPLPHAVANSFIGLMRKSEVDLVITHPKGYELNRDYTGECPVVYDQDKALMGADFVYVKNWSSYSDYGKVLHQDASWMMDANKLGAANFMHCLPVRRNVVVNDAVLDGGQSLVLAQAENRTFAAQLVLKKLLESL